MGSFFIYLQIILCFRTTSLKWPLSCEGEDQTWSSTEVHTKQFPQNLPRTPTTAASQGLGLYTILPPIGKPVAGKEPKLSSGQRMNTAHSYPIHRSSSDSYLVQMVKQKQLRVRVTSKVGVVFDLHLCPERRVLACFFFYVKE